MIKIITAYLTTAIILLAMGSGALNNTCKGCHPLIYAEFTSSAHKKSSIQEDSIHKAIWDIHPNKSKNDYTCKECHTPVEEEQLQASEAISCVYCHSIKNIEQHSESFDKNILVENDQKRPTLYATSKENRDKKVIYGEKKRFFGMFKSTTGSPYHDIDYTNNNYYTGKMCMGCHGHFENDHGQNVCKVDESGANNEKKNCITCHMPQVKGSATTIAISKTHTYHGFAGLRNKPQMLAKYLEIDFMKKVDGFVLAIENKATHNLMLHPLRLGLLKVKVNDGVKTTVLGTKKFLRILGKNNKPAMPWLATEIFKDTMLKANEKREISYSFDLNKGDVIDVEFGYYLVNPKMLKKLNLENDKEARSYQVLKNKTFTVK